MKTKINTRELIHKIERLTRERMIAKDVVSLSDLRKIKKAKAPPSLLIIEDDEPIRTALQRLFENEGYKVRTASDGTQLSAVLDDQPIDLLILDIGLPWINGFELAEMMKAHDDLKKNSAHLYFGPHE